MFCILDTDTKQQTVKLQPTRYLENGTTNREEREMNPYDNSRNSSEHESNPNDAKDKGRKTSDSEATPVSNDGANQTPEEGNKQECDCDMYMNVGGKSHFIEMSKLKEFVCKLHADDQMLKSEFKVLAKYCCCKY